MKEEHTLESLGNQITDLRKDMDDRFDALPNVFAKKDSLSKTNEELAKKVSISWFLSVLLTILGLQATLFYFMWSKIEQISENTQETKQTVANIEGKLEPFDFVIQK